MKSLKEYILKIIKVWTINNVWSGLNTLQEAIENQGGTYYAMREIRKEVKALKDDGMIELVPTYNEDGMVRGSGYFVTMKGLTKKT